MVEKNRIIEVTNRDSGRIGYTIPDLGNLQRAFAPGETKKIQFEELEKLSWVPGGKKILKDYLVIKDNEAISELLGEVEPEYYYDKDSIIELLTNGSLEQLQDTLELAPEGVIEILKQEAVNLPLNNVAMREEIKKATNFDVDRAIKVKKESQEEDIQDLNNSNKKRRSTPIITTTARKSTPIIVKK